MFNDTKKIEKLESEIIAKVSQIETLKEEVYELKRQNTNLKTEQETRLKLKDMELDLKIQEVVKETSIKNTALEQENAVLKKEISILEKAFENMGFDVKDMKDILDQLVKGIVSKNTINVVK